MSSLEYDNQTLNTQDYSYRNQLADLERDGWEIDPNVQAGDTVYLRRHQGVADLQHRANLKRKYIRFARADDSTWIASFFPALPEGTPNEFPGETALEAAEAAWAWGEANL